MLMQGTTEPALQPLKRLVGSWIREATHPALPGVIVHGTVAIDWLEGQRFLILRSRNDHPDFPDAISIIGFTDADRVGAHADESAASGGSRLCMHYFDSRGIFRVYEVNVDDEAWRLSRDAHGFSQRFTGSFADSGDTIVGWQLCRDDAHWDDDLQIIYRRQ
jgi:hypothetical protein